MEVLVNKRCLFQLLIAAFFAPAGVAHTQECDLDSRSDRTYAPFIDEKRMVDGWTERADSLWYRVFTFGGPPVEYFILRAQVVGQIPRTTSAIWGTGIDIDFEILEVLTGDPSVAPLGKVIRFPDKEILQPCREGVASLSQLAKRSEWIFPARAKSQGSHWQLLTFPHFLRVRDGVVTGVLYNWKRQTEESSLADFRQRLLGTRR
jgi:hypothetical protein